MNSKINNDVQLDDKTSAEMSELCKAVAIANDKGVGCEFIYAVVSSEADGVINKINDAASKWL